MSRKRTAADADLDKAELCNAEFPNLWQDAQREASHMYVDEVQYDAMPVLGGTPSTASQSALIRPTSSVAP